MLPLLRSENLSFAKIIMARRCEIQVLKIIKTRIIDNLIKRVPPCDSGSTLHFSFCLLRLNSVKTVSAVNPPTERLDGMNTVRSIVKAFTPSTLTFLTL